MSETENAPVEVTEGAPAVADTPAPEPAQEAQETPSEAQETASEPEAEKPKQEPWFQKRIATLTWEKNEEKRQREALTARIAELERVAKPQQPETGEQTPPGQVKPLTSADIEKLASTMAEQKLAEKQRDAEARAAAKAVNDAIRVGQLKYTPEAFNAACNTLAQLGANETPGFVQDVTDFENGADILNHLGNDPEKASELLAMHPRRRIRALTLMSQELAAPKPPKATSKAPAPITPVSGIAKGEPDPGKMPMKEYVEMREKQMREARH